MTYDTKNPVPSIDPRDLDDNAQAFDRFMSSSANTEPDRWGVPRLTWHYVEAAAGALASPNVVGLSSLTSAANKGFRFMGSSGQMATYDLSALGVTLAGIADAAAGRAAIGAIGSADNAASASKLATPRTIAATGDGAWSINFDGSGNATGAFTLSDTGVAAGTYVRVTVNSKGQVTAGQTSALALANGGTGATSATAARSALGAAAAPSAFIALPLNNSWVAISGRRAVYRLFVDCVQLEVNISSGTATDGTVLATLPTGFRPAAQIVLPVSSAPNTPLSSTVSGPRVTINTDGTITCTNCGNASIAFSALIPTV